jgi:hypothetical protein
MKRSYYAVLERPPFRRPDLPSLAWDLGKDQRAREQQSELARQIAVGRWESEGGAPNGDALKAR